MIGALQLLLLRILAGHLLFIVAEVMLLIIGFLLLLEFRLLLLLHLAVRIHVLAIAQLKELEGLPVLISDVVHIRQTIKIINKMKHLFVSLIIIEWNDGNTIVNLECKTVNTIVDDDDVFEISIAEDS